MYRSIHPDEGFNVITLWKKHGGHLRLCTLESVYYSYMAVLFISNHNTVKPRVVKYYFNKRKMQIKRQEITKKACKNLKTKKKINLFIYLWLVFNRVTNKCGMIEDIFPRYFKSFTGTCMRKEILPSSG